MAASTPRFQLNYFGGNVSGAIDDDGDKYTSADRLTIDSVLAALEKHTHHPGTSLTVPASVPDLSFDTGGSLSAGLTYFYVVSFVTADGLETVAGPEASITLPDVLSTPIPPTAETEDAGGALTPGVYYYAVSGLRGSTEESAQSDYTIVTCVDSGDNAVLVTLPALNDADTLQVWRMKESDPSWTRIGVTAGATFTDDGSVPAALYGDPANIAPVIASGTNDYEVTLTLTAADVTNVEAATSWRLYRSTISGTYSAASLVHEVVERVDDLDPTSALLTAWIDDGEEAITGAPKVITNQLSVAPYVFERVATLPDAGGYPDNYPLLDTGGTLYVNTAGTWTAISGTGGGGSGTQRGLAFMGTWTSGASTSPGYLAGDVVVYDEQLWQALNPISAQAPSATTTYAASVDAATATAGLGSQYAWPFEVNTAFTLGAFDWYTLGASTQALALRLVVSLSKVPAGPYLFNITITPPSTPGWSTITLPAAVALAPGTTYALIAYSGGTGVSDNVGVLASSIAYTGNIAASGEIYYDNGFQSYDGSANLATRLYDASGGATWEVLASFGSTQRGVATFTGEGAPSPEPAGSLAGDLYIDLSTGDYYTLQGS